ncbi:MAG: hypothetical protein IKP95_11665 [Ruminococcus sp.]|nr:hypothetical protein [Ruminococcus sp.]
MKAYLIDFENVKSKGLTGIEALGSDDKVIIFYSENSDTISFEMHCKVMSSTADIEYLKVRVGGKNALDFQLSTLLGYLLAKEQYTHIFIISGDKGFDKLHDFWNVSFADKNSCIVFRTQTIAAAVEFASKHKQRGKAEEPVLSVELEAMFSEASQPEPVDETVPEEAPVIEEIPAEDELPIIEAAPAEEPPAPEPAPEPVKEAQKPAKKRTKRLPSAATQIRNALLGLFDLSDDEIATIVACAAGSEDKEDFHNALAKIFKAQATDLYKVLRPKYLKIKEALSVTEEEAPQPETPAEPIIEAAPEAAAEEIPAEAPAEEKPADKPKKKPSRRSKQKASKSPLLTELEKRLAGECSDEEIAAVARLFEETDSKQKLYLSIVKEYRKDRGCEIYKLIKSDYTALSKLKAVQEV